MIYGEQTVTNHPLLEYIKICHSRKVDVFFMKDDDFP